MFWDESKHLVGYSKFTVKSSNMWNLIGRRHVTSRWKIYVNNVSSKRIPRLPQQQKRS